MFAQTEAQVMLRWLIQRGDITAIPANLQRRAAKREPDSVDVQLSADEMERMGSLTCPGIEADPPTGWVSGRTERCSDETGTFLLPVEPDTENTWRSLPT